MKVWFEDSVPQDLLDGMAETRGTYTLEKQRKAIEEIYGGIVASRREEITAMLPKETNVETKA